jgi:hypothetical protein
MDAFLFYVFSVAMGLGGLLALPIAIDGRFDEDLQGASKNLFVGPLRKVLLFAFAGSALFCSGIAWVGTPAAVMFGWGASGFFALAFLLPALLEGGVPGLRAVNRKTWSWILLVAFIAAELSYTARAVS